VTDKTEPLPTTMEEGWVSEGGLGEDVTRVGWVWLVAPKSATQSVMGVGGVGAVELRQSARD
jgi:hypothetical protein